MNPIVVSDSRRAARAKHKSGNAVTGPAINNQNAVDPLPLENAIFDDE
jgi:hypothetical protein